MTTSHNLATYETVGDVTRANCIACNWVSEWFDTKTEARKAMAGHRLSEDLKKK